MKTVMFSVFASVTAVTLMAQDSSSPIRVGRLLDGIGNVQEVPILFPGAP